MITPHTYTPPSAHTMTLAELLLYYQAVDELTLSRAISEASDVPLYYHLISQQLLDAATLAHLQAVAFGMSIKSPSDFLASGREHDSTTDSLPTLDDKLVRRHRVLILAQQQGAVLVGMADITDALAINAVRFALRMPVTPVLLHADALALALDEAIGLQFTAHESQADNHPPSDDYLGMPAAAIDDEPAVRFVHETLSDAVRRGVSDVHFEPYETSFRVRMRIDGSMQIVATPPRVSAASIATRLKVMAGLDISERRKPQDGRIKFNHASGGCDFRVSTLPTLFGEKIVLRLMGSVGNLLGIDKLGMSAKQQAQFRAAIQKPQGMILITGPTGSGKSASLYTALATLNRADINILTAEDPVEMNISGINQVNINSKIGLDFADVLRAFLRQDPDVIMVGEIRDAATAEIATKAAQTGHLVLSTLHTNSSAQSISRLHHMGVPRFHLASSLTLIIAQRLARRLCDLCKQVHEVPAASLLEAGFSKADIAGSPIIYAPVGCPHCRHGYRGRVGLFEFLPVTQAIAKLILDDADSHTIAAANQQAGNDSLLRAGIAQVVAGNISLTEMHRIIANW